MGAILVFWNAFLVEFNGARAKTKLRHIDFLFMFYGGAGKED